MKTIQVTLQERWAASKHQVHKSKKTYTRKDKHKKKGSYQGPSFFYHLVVGITNYRNRRTCPSTLPTLSQSQAPYSFLTYLKI